MILIKTMLKCTRFITALSAQQPKGFNMLTDFDKDLAGIDLTADNAMELILAAANTRSDGLSNKNTELLGKLTSNDGLSAAEKAQLTELQAFKSNSEITAAKTAEDWQKASDLQAEAWAAKDKAKDERITGFEKGERTRLITDGIRSELTGLKVNPLHSDTTAAYFESMSQVVDGKAMIGDKTQSEFIKEWALSDSGKASCLAQDNSGGDGNGGGKTPAGGTPETLEACKGDKKLEAEYFNKQMAG